MTAPHVELESGGHNGLSRDDESRVTSPHVGVEKRSHGGISRDEGSGGDIAHAEPERGPQWALAR